MQSENNKIDEGLFAKIADGDNEAFAQLYYASYKQLYGFLLSLMRNKEDAEDMLQNTYIKVRNGSHLYTKQGTPMAPPRLCASSSSWLTISSNCATSLLPRAKPIDRVIATSSCWDALRVWARMLKRSSTICLKIRSFKTTRNRSDFNRRRSMP